MCHSRTTACPVLKRTHRNRVMDKGGLTAGGTISSWESPRKSQPAVESSHLVESEFSATLLHINTLSEIH